mmetsp:Transcript_2384/g.3265  ORF Transcript_2384/g.3265 Transcript_2384/m.3265 type:complete len:111 (+) Transcript_2384:1806-2138(+)
MEHPHVSREAATGIVIMIDLDRQDRQAVLHDSLRGGRTGVAASTVVKLGEGERIGRIGGDGLPLPRKNPIPQLLQIMTMMDSKMLLADVEPERTSLEHTLSKQRLSNRIC